MWIQLAGRHVQSPSLTIPVIQLPAFSRVNYVYTHIYLDQCVRFWNPIANVISASGPMCICRIFVE